MHWTWDGEIARRSAQSSISTSYWFTATRAVFMPVSRAIDHFRFVQFIMLLSAHYFQILNSIVLSVVIFMVNYFRRKKFSIKKFLHDIPMFKNVGVVNPKINIPITNYPFMEILHPSNITFVAAHHGAELSSYPITPHDKRRTTNKTDFINVPIFMNFFRKSFFEFIFAFVGTEKTSTSFACRFNTFAAMFTRYPHANIISF